MAADTDIAYLAGLIDGEGYIGIKKSKAYRCQGRRTPGYSARIQVRMVDEAAIRFLAETFGAWYYLEKRRPKKNRPLYCCQLGDKKAEAALRALLPYLRVKREQAETVLAFCDLKASGTAHRTKVTGYRDLPGFRGGVRRVPNLTLSDEHVAKREGMWTRCRELNRVGVRA